MKSDTPSTEAYAAAALELGCEERAIRAVAKVEAGKLGAFLDSGEPVLLFEPRVFRHETDHRFDGATAVIDGKHWPLSTANSPGPGEYGPSSIQHAKLAAASLLDRDAARKSCSWGLFQVMARNYQAAGYETLQEFVNAAYRSADDHLRMFVGFIKSDSRLVSALRAKDWRTFKRIFNGPAENGYALRMAEAYRELVA